MRVEPFAPALDCLELGFDSPVLDPQRERCAQPERIGASDRRGPVGRELHPGQ